MTNQDNPKPVLPSISAGSPTDGAPRGSLREMKNDADPQIRRFIDDIFAGKRTMHDLAAAEWSGRRVHEARLNLKAIREEVEKLEKEPGAADRITKKSE